MKIQYANKNFRRKSLDLISLSNKIIDEYLEQGFLLTLRQLYYQMVARDHIENSQKSYSNFGNLIGDSRMAGLIDWSVIEDRTRTTYHNSHWNHPNDIIESARQSFHLDYWENQKYKPCVWIEKEALSGIISDICNELDIPYLACRGYMSLTAMHNYALKAGKQLKNDNKPVIIHLGDHDPSGIDMSRDIKDRMSTFGIHDIEVIRIALNMSQVEEYGPPANPTKLTDSRANGYISEYGYDSWELDALEPNIIIELIRREVESLIDYDAWNKELAIEKKHKQTLKNIENNYDNIVQFLKEND